MSEQSDFLAEVPDPNAGVMSDAQRRAIAARQRDGKSGHAARPGTGPTGETCGSCRHYSIKQMSRSHRKCGLMRDQWTNGPGTDIRARDPACIKWEA